jgi:glycogen synthase
MTDLRKVKVCFLAGTLGQGGVERQLFFMMRTFLRSGAQPRVLCLGRNELWEDPIKALGVPVTWVGQSKLRFQRLLRIVQELRKDPPAVFQSHHFYTNAYVVAAARMLGLPEIGAMQNDGISEVRDSGRIGGVVNLRAPRLMTVNSEAGLQYALSSRIPAARLYSMPTLIDTEQFKPGACSEDKALRLLAVGRLHPQKRMDRFLSVVARLCRTTNRRIKAIIAGAGPLRGALEQQAGELGLLPDTVEFVGGVSNIVPLYQQADIFVLTSDYEGLPNVVLEAMACGLPVVVTPAGGVPHIVRDGETGFMVPTRDEEAMVAAILRLSNDPQLRNQMGQRGRMFVENSYSLERMPGLLAGLYQRALN